MNYISFQSFKKSLCFFVLSVDENELHLLRNYCEYIDSVGNTVLLYFSSESQKELFVEKHMRTIFQKAEVVHNSNYLIVYREQNCYFVFQKVCGQQNLYKVLQKLYAQYTFEIEEYLDGADIEDITSFENIEEVDGSISSSDNSIIIYFETVQTQIISIPFLKIVTKNTIDFSTL